MYSLILNTTQAAPIFREVSKRKSLIHIFILRLIRFVISINRI